jgi:Tfp pilus assembly protein PilO
VSTAGLANASATLATSIDRLALSISKLSEGGADLSDEEKKVLLDAVQSVQKASSALAGLARQLPQATENASQLVESALDAALQRLVIYTILLVAIVALALIGIMWFIYRQYLRPLTRKLDELVGAPEHFENMARHMKDTAASLQACQAGAPRGASRYRRH